MAYTFETSFEFGTVYGHGGFARRVTTDIEVNLMFDVTPGRPQALNQPAEADEIELLSIAVKASGKWLTEDEIGFMADVIGDLVASDEALKVNMLDHANQVEIDAAEEAAEARRERAWMNDIRHSHASLPADTYAAMKLKGMI